MKTPIIMVAFGTTSKAVKTYQHLNECIRDHFPSEEILWAYSSRVIAREVQNQEGVQPTHPEELLGTLASKGVKQAVIQSLHLFPGTEFHNLSGLARNSQVRCATGFPLLTSPEDYHEIGEICHPVISKRPDQAILVLGHGTVHPSWTSYYSLEKLLRQKYGERIYVGTVEKYPDSSHLISEIAAAGFTKVCIIPLFLVAGMHYRRDIISEEPASWKSQLEAKNMTVETLDYGLGLMSGFEKIIIRHITAARKLLMKS